MSSSSNDCEKLRNAMDVSNSDSPSKLTKETESFSNGKANDDESSKFTVADQLEIDIKNSEISRLNLEVKIHEIEIL